MHITDIRNRVMARCAHHRHPRPRLYVRFDVTAPGPTPLGGQDLGRIATCRAGRTIDNGVGTRHFIGWRVDAQRTDPTASMSTDQLEHTRLNCSNPESDVVRRRRASVVARHRVVVSTRDYATGT